MQEFLERAEALRAAYRARDDWNCIPELIEQLGLVD